jgi:hypothetical protein
MVLAANAWTDPATLTGLIVAITAVLGAIPAIVIAIRSGSKASKVQTAHAVVEGKVETIERVLNGAIVNGPTNVGAHSNVGSDPNRGMDVVPRND